MESLINDDDDDDDVDRHIPWSGFSQRCARHRVSGWYLRPWFEDQLIRMRLSVQEHALQPFGGL